MGIFASSQVLGGNNGTGMLFVDNGMLFVDNGTQVAPLCLLPSSFLPSSFPSDNNNNNNDDDDNNASGLAINE
tara:strand:+ start:168 stop:386 length:219 start_codon:yes stop_codon:yes gene_type:complete